MEINGLGGAQIHMNGLDASRVRVNVGTPVRDAQTSAGLNASPMRFNPGRPIRDAQTAALLNASPMRLHDGTPIRDAQAAALLNASLMRFNPADDGERAKITQVGANGGDDWCAVVKGIRFLFKHIPAGTYKMGIKRRHVRSWDGAKKKGLNSGIAFMPDEEARARRVKITRDFWIMQSQVTIAAFARFLQTTKRAVPTGAIGYNDATKKLERGDEYSFLNPGFPKFTNEGGDVLCPATCVDWATAVAFCDWLNEEFSECRVKAERLRLNFRLPTEAEWERACRAGSRTPYHFGRNERLLPNYGNYDDAAPATNIGNDGVDFLAQANQYAPNKWGLYHMCGNVWEWCADWYAPYESGRRAVVDPHGPSRGIMRTARGGAWNTAPVFCRSGARAAAPPWRRSVDLGFRVVMDMMK